MQLASQCNATTFLYERKRADVVDLLFFFFHFGGHIILV